MRYSKNLKRDLGSAASLGKMSFKIQEYWENKKDVLEICPKIVLYNPDSESILKITRSTWEGILKKIKNAFNIDFLCKKVLNVQFRIIGKIFLKKSY